VARPKHAGEEKKGRIHGTGGEPEGGELWEKTERDVTTDTGRKTFSSKYE